MAIVDLYSKRQKRARGDVPEVFTYDQLPNELRVKLFHVIRELLGAPSYNGVGDWPWQVYNRMVGILRREYGLLHLLGNKSFDDGDRCAELFNFFLGTPHTERALDVVELSAHTADKETRHFEYLGNPRYNERVDRGIEEINGRFREEGIGFRYELGKLIRIDSELLHVEAVKPALQLMHAHGYAGPLDEFVKAYDHFRHGRSESALTEALKAFESTMKTICTRKRWTYEKSATASKLVAVCLTNGLVDEFWNSQLTALRALLEGTATARNKCGSHGQGAEPRSVPADLVQYALNMTAAAIVFLIRSASV